MFEFCWFMSYVIVGIFYLAMIGLGIVTIYAHVNHDIDENSIMAKLSKILLFDFDDEDVYETE